ILAGKALFGTCLATAPSTSAPRTPRTSPLRREREQAASGFTKTIVSASLTGECLAMLSGNAWARLAMCWVPNLLLPI
ncbi:unnamed protein product, partial [Ectocarpus fasciculatus]